jgi:putative inorganic carbon (HCO3(-)) transporter
VDRVRGRPIDRRLVTAALVALCLAIEVSWGYWMAVWPVSPHVIVAAAVGLAVVAATFHEPVIGLYLFVATMLTEGSWMFGSVSAARLLGFLVLAAWIARGLASGRFAIIVPAQAWVALLFMVWAFVSVLWAMDTAKWLTAWLLLLQSTVLYLLVINLVNSLQRLHVILAIVIVVSLALALLTLYQVSGAYVARFRSEVGKLSVGDPNAHAAYLLPGAALLMALFSRQSHWPRKLMVLLGFSIMVLAILATSSRGGMIALALMLVIGALIDRGLWQLALPALLLGGVASLFLPQVIIERLRRLLTLADRGSGRVDIWLVAMRIIQSHPLLGVGLGSFSRAFDKYVSDTAGIVGAVRRGRVAHNIFLSAQGELGILGLILLVAFAAWSLARGLAAIGKWKRVGSPTMAALALATFLSLAGMMVVGLFLEALHWKLFWLLLALPEVMRRLSEQALQRTTLR